MALIHCQYTRLCLLLKFLTFWLVVASVVSVFYSTNWRRSKPYHAHNEPQRFPRFVPGRQELAREKHLPRLPDSAEGGQDEAVDSNENDKYMYNYYEMKNQRQKARQERFEPPRETNLNRQEGVDMDHFKDDEIEIPQALRDELWPKRTRRAYHNSRTPERITPQPEVATPSLPSSIYITPTGSLGGQLFQFASVYGIAKQTNRDAYLDPFFELSKTFANIKLQTKMMPPNVVIYQEDSPGFYSRELLKKTGDIGVCCYLQSWRYFASFFHDIKQQLKFNDDILHTAKSIIQEQHAKLFDKLMAQDRDETDVNDPTSLRKTIHHYVRNYTHSLKDNTLRGLHVTLVGLHVHRARGARGNENYDSTLPTVPKEYYEKAMNKLRADHSDVLFIVVTDEMDWCKTNLNFTYGDIVFAGHNEPEVDLAILSKMSHVITSLGPFSWWGGFLSRGLTYYYPNWIEQTLKTSTPYRLQHYYPPWWVSVPIEDKRKET